MPACLSSSSGDRVSAVEAAFPEIIRRFRRDDAPYAYAFSLQPLTGIALVGQIITVGENTGMQIIGVARDFHYRGLANRIEPVVLRYAPARFAFALVKVAPGAMTPAGVIENAWKELSVHLQPL